MSVMTVTVYIMIILWSWISFTPVTNYLIPLLEGVYTVSVKVIVACCLVFSFCSNAQRLFLIAILIMAEQQAVVSVTVQQLFHLHHSEQSNSKKKPYILESNPHRFYSFRGLKNQMRIRIACGLDSRSRAGFWKTDMAGVWIWPQTII
jgi:hypothetical protein